VRCSEEDLVKLANLPEQLGCGDEHDHEEGDD
jgi:hypothetical protein